MEGQVVKVTELNPQLEMEIGRLLRSVETRFTLPAGCELFTMMDSVGQVRGAASVACFDECCLLLFVAVRLDERGRGTGSMLVNHVLTHYTGRCERMYLLTGVEGFFGRFGFTKIPRDRLPEQIYRCAEESDILKPEAVAMFIDLPEGWAQR